MRVEEVERVRQALEFELESWTEIVKVAKTKAFKEEAERTLESCARQLRRLEEDVSAEQLRQLPCRHPGQVP